MKTNSVIFTKKDNIVRKFNRVSQFEPKFFIYMIKTTYKKLD